MRRIEFIKPTLELVKDSTQVQDDFYAKLKVTPLERGYGMTLGNSLRRVLLSSIPGAAAVAIRISGVQHEFCAVNGVKEDVTQIILNMKNVIFTINKEDNENGVYTNEDNLLHATLEVSIPSLDEQKKKKVKESEQIEYKVVKASDINLNSLDNICIVNPDQELFTIMAGGSVSMDILIRNGVGYVGANENKSFLVGEYSHNNGYLAIDSIFTPVSRCKYEVSKTRYLNNFDCDQLVLEVWTNGSMLANNAISMAAKFLVEHFNLIANLNENISNNVYIAVQDVPQTNELLDKKVEDLNLTARSYNCLIRNNIRTVGELVQKTEEEMYKIKNLGRKSLKGIVLRLRELGLDLKNSSSFTQEELEHLEEDEDDVVEEI